MNILIAMDSLKGSLSSIEANKACEEGFLQADSRFRIETVPVADGGEGTVEALVYAADGQFFEAEVTGPLGKIVKARYGILGGGRTGVIEAAEACGLPLLKRDERNPMEATAFGLGELIHEVIEKGCTEIIVGLGGSATNDAGIGMLQALGYRFLDDNGEDVRFGGKELIRISEIDDSGVSERLKDIKFRVACDVTNPLYGMQGAAHVFAPQKGADPEMVLELDKGLEHFAQAVLSQLQINLQEIRGAGAAGGLGAAFAGFLDAELESGISLILEQTKLKEKLLKTELVITGEGKLDGQTSMGKAPAGIAQLAKEKNIPVIALAGDVSEGGAALYEAGVTAFFSIVSGPVDLETALDPEVARSNIKRAAEQIGRVWRLNKSAGL
ncbi:glycerate kinase [Metabacillus sp. GX 13764]|uniref:glycerate kinase family protein n=1 Tax=Metabacillus kandeliae TaxID=2900151 RepID=UPI001E599A0B|nr:glycerate kinase [Metabacillus kandeliae]MCD7035991.1 glycerate kinase [Metabacillus kandeliae]